MEKGKKFDYRVVQESTGWTAEITRRKTSKETVVSKSKPGFSTESEAKAWGEKALESFLQSLNERNKRRSKKRDKDAQ
ncbi:MAG: DUF3622 domain-containing protein [Gammaproteobacteria bacterium]|nr:DUF3622 domain-containing protein [Gammaproteobacteria bacterium]